MPLLDIILKDSTNRSLTLRMADSSDGTPETGVTSATSGLDIWYHREGAAKVSLTESDLSALTDAHSDGGILHISDGEYRVDFPDAAFATGANYVDVGWGATGMVGFGGRVRLTGIDIEDAVRGGMSALPNAAAEAAGGLITRGTGTGQLNVSGGYAPSDLYRIFGTLLQETSAQNLAGNFSVLFDNGDAGTSLTLDDIATAAQLADGTVVASAVTAGVTLANGAITNASPAGNVEIDLETDFATNYNTTRNAWATNVQAFGGTSTSDPFNGQVVAASVTGNVGGDVAGNVDGTVAGVTPAAAGDQMDLVDAPNATAVTAIQNGLSTFDSTTDGVDLNADQSGVTIGTVTTNTDMRGTDNALLAASITLSGGAVTVGTNNDKTGYALSSTGLDQITPAEPSAVITFATSTLPELIAWIGAFTQNKVTETSTTQTLRNAADNADIATATVSDDGTTFTRGAFS